MSENPLYQSIHATEAASTARPASTPSSRPPSRESNAMPIVNPYGENAMSLQEIAAFNGSMTRAEKKAEKKPVRGPRSSAFERSAVDTKPSLLARPPRPSVFKQSTDDSPHPFAFKQSTDNSPHPFAFKHSADDFPRPTGVFTNSAVDVPRPTGGFKPADNSARPTGGFKPADDSARPTGGFNHSPDTARPTGGFNHFPNSAKPSPLTRPFAPHVVSPAHMDAFSPPNGSQSVATPSTTTSAIPPHLAAKQKAQEDQKPKPQPDASEELPPTFKYDDLDAPGASNELTPALDYGDHKAENVTKHETGVAKLTKLLNEQFELEDTIAVASAKLEQVKKETRETLGYNK